MNLSRISAIVQILTVLTVSTCFADNQIQRENYRKSKEGNERYKQVVSQDIREINKKYYQCLSQNAANNIPLILSTAACEVLRRDR